MRNSEINQQSTDVEVKVNYWTNVAEKEQEKRKKDTTISIISNNNNSSSSRKQLKLLIGNRNKTKKRTTSEMMNVSPFLLLVVVASLVPGASLIQAAHSNRATSSSSSSSLSSSNSHINRSITNNSLDSNLVKLPSGRFTTLSTSTTTTTTTTAAPASASPQRLILNGPKSANKLMGRSHSRRVVNHHHDLGGSSRLLPLAAGQVEVEFGNEQSSYQEQDFTGFELDPTGLRQHPPPLVNPNELHHNHQTAFMNQQTPNRMQQQSNLKPAELAGKELRPPAVNRVENENDGFDADAASAAASAAAVGRLQSSDQPISDPLAHAEPFPVGEIGTARRRTNSIKVVFNNNPQFIIGRDQQTELNPASTRSGGDFSSLASSNLHHHHHQRAGQSGEPNGGSLAMDRDVDESRRDETKVAIRQAPELALVRPCDRDHRGKDSHHHDQEKVSIPHMEQVDLGPPPRKDPQPPPRLSPPPEIKTTRVEQQLDEQVITPFEQAVKSGLRPPLRMVISMRNKNGDTMKVPINLHGSSKKKQQQPQQLFDLAAPMQVHFEPPILQQQQQQEEEQKQTTIDENTPLGGDVFDPSIVKPFPKTKTVAKDAADKTNELPPLMQQAIQQQQQQQEELPLPLPQPQAQQKTNEPPLPQPIDEKPQIKAAASPTVAPKTKPPPLKRPDCVEQQQQQQQQQSVDDAGTREPHIGPMIVGSSDGILHMMVPKITSLQNRTFASMFAQFQKALTEQISQSPQALVPSLPSNDDQPQGSPAQQSSGRKLVGYDEQQEQQQQQQRDKQQFQDDQEDLMVAMLAANVTQQQQQQQQLADNSKQHQQQHMSMTVIKPPKGTTLSEAIRMHAQNGPQDPTRTVAILHSIGSRVSKQPSNGAVAPQLADILPPSSLDDGSQPPNGVDVRLKQGGNRNPSQHNQPAATTDNNVDPDGFSFSSSNAVQTFYRHLFGGLETDSNEESTGSNDLKRHKRSTESNSSSNNNGSSSSSTSTATNTTTISTNNTTTASSPADVYGKQLELSDKLANQVSALNETRLSTNSTTNGTAYAVAPAAKIKMEKRKKIKKNQLMNKRMGSSAAAAAAADRDFLESAASEESEQRENEVPDYVDDSSSDDDTDASDSNDEPSSTSAGGGGGGDGGGGGSSNDYGSSGSDSDSDPDSDDSDADLYSDGSGGFGDESADDEPFNQAAASSTNGDYTAAGSFEIPQIEINPNTLRQEGCRTVLKEVQEIPMNGMGVMKDHQSAYGGAASSPATASYSVGGLRRVRRHSDNLINSRKVTSIVLTKECHFPNGSPTKTTTTTNNSQLKPSSKPQLTGQSSSAASPRAAPISMESNNNRQQQLPLQQMVHQHQYDPHLHNQLLVQQHQQQRLLQAATVPSRQPSQQVNQIRRRSVGQQQQPARPMRPADNIGADSRRTEVIAQKSYKPPSADNPYHVLSISSKSGFDPDGDSDEDDRSFVMDEPSSGGRSSNSNLKQRRRQPDGASSRQHRMRETLSEKERKALADPNYDDTDPVNQRNGQQQQQQQDGDDGEQEARASGGGGGNEQDADENDADLADESSNTRTYQQQQQSHYQRPQQQQQQQQQSSVRNNNNRSPPPAPVGARQAEQAAQRMEAASGATLARLKQQQQQQQAEPTATEQRFGRSFKFEHQVGRPPSSGLMAQLQNLKPGRQGFVSVAQSPPPLAGRRNDADDADDGDDDDDGDDEDSSSSNRQTSNRAAEDPDADPEYNPRESRLPAHTKPKRVQKSFAYVHRDSPRSGQNPDDFVLSYGRGKLQTEHEDYDSDREQPAGTNNRQQQLQRQQQQEAAEQSRRRAAAATTQRASYLRSINPLMRQNSNSNSHSPVAAAAAAALQLQPQSNYRHQVDSYPGAYRQHHHHHNHHFSPPAAASRGHQPSRQLGVAAG